MRREREDGQRPWIFFLVFCCSSNVLIRWFHLYRLESSVRPLFGAHGNFRLSSHSPSKSSSHLRANGLSNQSRCLTAVWCRWEEHIHFRRFPSCAEDSGPPFFFKSFLITVVIHPWLADLQRVLYLDSVDSLFAFSFLSLSPEISLPCSLWLEPTISCSIMLQNSYS